MEVESTFSVSPGFYEKIGKYKKGVSEYEFRFGHTPTDQQISVFLDMPLKTIESIKTVLSPTIPFDALGGDDGNTTIREVVSDGSRFEDDVEMREDALSLWETIEKRVDDGRNLEILRLRFCEGWSIPRIADEYGISRQRVDQICKKSLEKVRRDDRISDYIVQEVDSMNDYSGSGFTAFNRRWASSVEWSVLNREKKKERLSGRIKSKKAAIDRKYSFLGVDSTEKGFDNSGE